MRKRVVSMTLDADVIEGIRKKAQAQTQKMRVKITLSSMVNSLLRESLEASNDLSPRS